MANTPILVQVAEMIIRRVLDETHSNTNLAEALRRVYPFEDDPRGRQVWAEALQRAGLANDADFENYFPPK